MERTVRVTHLEMTARAQLVPARPPTVPLAVTRVEIPSPDLNRWLYATVGAPWTWYELRPWSRAQWAAFVDRPELETWLATVSGTPAGYFELERQEGGSVEIVHFGLLPAFIGKRLGGALLTAAVERAWAMGAARVWLHTCDTDHPRALDNYRARGFTVFKVEQRTENLPDAPLEAWPGAGGA